MTTAAVDCRGFFRPVIREIVHVLRSCSEEHWLRPTVAGSWRVRDVAAHMLDTAIRRLSFHRDGMEPPPPPRPIANERDLAAFINGLNAEGVRAGGRMSVRVLTDLYERVGADLADFAEQLSLDAPARFPVSWAGESGSRAWLDIGREFTEVWHHGQQIRDALGAGPFDQPRWLHAVLEIAMHGLPHAYADLPDPAGPLCIAIGGPSGGTWTLSRRGGNWTIAEDGGAAAPAATASMSDDTAWRLLFNGLAPDAARARIDLDGDPALLAPLFRARSVIV